MKWFRWWWLLLLVPVALGLARLHFDAEILDLLPAEVPAVEGLKLYQQHFTNARELLITIQAPDADAARDAAQAIAVALRARSDLASRVIWQPPWLDNPGQTAELIAYLWLNQPPAVFKQLADRLLPANLPGVLAATRDQLATTLSPAALAQLSYDPYGFTRLPESLTGMMAGAGQGDSIFASADGTFRVLFVSARGPLADYRECSAWLAAVQQVTQAAVPYGGRLKLGYTGRPAFVAEISASMRRDIIQSTGGTALMIACLFWLAHRRWKPMLWLLTLLGGILLCTLGIGGLIFGSVSVISMGFAAILLGLAVDYAVVHYQEAIVQPTHSIPRVRRAIAPAIFWAAVTTISAFLVLNFGGLPGLAQLGSLVAIGVGFSAVMMIFAYLPPLFPERMGSEPETVESRRKEPRRTVPLQISPRRRQLVFVFTLGLLLVCAGTSFTGFPRMDATADALRPRDSQAYTTLDAVQAHLVTGREPVWLVVAGTNEAEVARRLNLVQPVLEKGVASHLLTGFVSPSAFWPRADFQSANRSVLTNLIAEQGTLHSAAAAAGFTEASLGLTDGVFTTWRNALADRNPFWPTNPLSAWIFEKLAVRETNQCLAAAFLFPSATVSSLAPLAAGLPRDGVWLSSWALLGETVLAVVQHNLWKLLLPMAALILCSLWLAFRRPHEVVLSLAVLFLSGATLLAVMKTVGWSWNLLNLMALPLILGTGVDYSIFMQLALRRYAGDLGLAQRAVGRALLLCGGTAIAGFGSLGLSSNAGMSSLGRVCAVGIAGNMIYSIFLLPVWWKRFAEKPADTGALTGPQQESYGLEAGPPSSQPSPPGEGESLSARDAVDRLGARQTRPRVGSLAQEERVGCEADVRLRASNQSDHRSTSKAVSGPPAYYHSHVWQLGLWLVRWLPRPLCAALAKMAADIFWHVAPHRREIVRQNLLPVLDGDAAAARRAARQLFTEFALKLCDLWRYEGGDSSPEWYVDWKGWEIFIAAKDRGRGVLLVTPHLGNWELGGPFMVRHGCQLLVLTQDEPDPRMTRMRQASRSRWGVETLVVGQDAFAMLEVIKRLNAGATVALLVDRPPPATAVTVEFLGQPFSASIAVAELARASGCAIVPTFIVREPGGYRAQILPEIHYDRAVIGSREQRVKLAGEILRAFAPAVRQYAAQWYHFVPVWNGRKK